MDRSIVLEITQYKFFNKKYGELGLGHFNKTSSPQLITSLNNITQISAVYDHSIVLLYNGLVYSFGRNNVFIN